ncbi:hypothetical protein Tco_0934152, partial [Tanacetum coccineum]
IDPEFSEDSRVRCFVPVHSSFLAFACHLSFSTLDKRLEIFVILSAGLSYAFDLFEF